MSIDILIKLCQIIVLVPLAIVFAIIEILTAIVFIIWIFDTLKGMIK